MTDLSPGPSHLNQFGCVIKVSADKGRGLYASRPISRNTLIEVSPVLFFSKEEYTTHGKYTVLDHYTFNWPDGRMALALGLGSLFNHADPPNVSFSLDTSTGSIRYTTTRDIEPGEELCIFYGHKLWFSLPFDVGRAPSPSPTDDDGWGRLASINDDCEEEEARNPYIDGDPNEIIPEHELPFTRFKLPPEEEEPGSIRTVQVWAVDIPDQRHITTMLKWLKQSGFDGPELGHLKRIRRSEGQVSMLINIADSDTPPTPPEELSLPIPYQIAVPSSSALTPVSLALKSAIWPTVFTPRRKDEPEPWTRSKLSWAWEAIKMTTDAATVAAKESNELHIAAYIPTPCDCNTFDENVSSSMKPQAVSFLGHDTRQSNRHPLKHAAINTIRTLADHHASLELSKTRASTSEQSSGEEDPELQNGSNYLLTDMSFFITHEPCVMCSMALLHSRVKDVFYLYPMPRTGGCGGLTCLTTLKGVNHRFNIFQWKLDKFPGVDLALDDTIDV